MMKEALLAIDPQRDFTVPGGALYVKGAEGDMERLAAFAGGNVRRDIFVTMDSHRRTHISHPGFWTDAGGNHPAPFTVITFREAAEGKWKAAVGGDMVLDYLEKLERRGKKHTVWPEHCVMNTPGYRIHESLEKTLARHVSGGGRLAVIHKGDCLFAEHFSAVRAEVENDLFPETKANAGLLRALASYDRIFLAGECADICVRETLRDLTALAPEAVAGMTVLSDCMSPLKEGFSFTEDEVYAAAAGLGARISDSRKETARE